jgi:hypothetical protein
MKMPNPGAHVREVANEVSLLTGSHGANLNAIVEHFTSSVRSLSSEDEDHDIRDDWQVPLIITWFLRVLLGLALKARWSEA